MEREELFIHSQEFDCSGVNIGSLFPNLPDKYKSLDAFKSYSLFQYLEMLYIISELSSAGVNQITFLLPNAEYKYYKFDFFSHDIKRILSINIVIKFLSFRYTKHITSRPYNSGKEIVSKLTCDLLM